jgi:hypothetical protein
MGGGESSTIGGAGTRLARGERGTGGGMLCDEKDFGSGGARYTIHKSSATVDVTSIKMSWLRRFLDSPVLQELQPI